MIEWCGAVRCGVQSVVPWRLPSYCPTHRRRLFINSIQASESVGVRAGVGGAKLDARSLVASAAQHEHNRRKGLRRWQRRLLYEHGSYCFRQLYPAGATAIA